MLHSGDTSFLVVCARLPGVLAWPGSLIFDHCRGCPSPLSPFPGVTGLAPPDQSVAGASPIREIGSLKTAALANEEKGCFGVGQLLLTDDGDAAKGSRPCSAFFHLAQRRTAAVMVAIFRFSKNRTTLCHRTKTTRPGCGLEQRAKSRPFAYSSQWLSPRALLFFPSSMLPIRALKT
jgi:hypothetical protein